MNQQKLNALLDWYEKGKLLEMNLGLFSDNFRDSESESNEALLSKAFLWLHSNGLKFLVKPTYIYFTTGKKRVKDQDMIVLFKRYELDGSLSLDWKPIGVPTESEGTILVYTPNNKSIQFRLSNPDDLNKFTEATHFLQIKTP